ncbi:MAG: signal peptidase II [Lentisphaeria bacterium]|nr:signal peptidase II [Lentisphaeria bacterium]
MNNMAKHRKIEPRSREEVRLLTLASGIAFFLLIVDQITKLMVEQRMRLGESIEIVKGFFSLTFVTNKGAAWGMFHGYGIILFVIGVAVMLSAIFFLRKLCDGYRERYIAILTVLSGVAGNSIDRIWRGEVVDFLDCYIKNHHWPAFNIADCAICVGIFIYMLSVLLRPAPETENKDNANAV